LDQAANWPNSSDDGQVDWFDTCRLLEPIGDIPPAKAETNGKPGAVRCEVSTEPWRNGCRRADQCPFCGNR